MAKPVLQIGVLAIQGDFEAHRRMLEGLGADVVEVRTPAELEALDGLVIPGGESTTITMGMEREGLDEAIRSRHADGLSIFGSCAGMIRAPWVEDAGPEVEVLGEVHGHPVAVRDRKVLAVAFHAELTDDSRLHAAFMAMCTAVRNRPERAHR